MIKNRINQAQLVLLIFVWTLLFTIPLLFGDFQNGIDFPHIIKIWKEYCILFILFLVNRFILMPYFFLKGKRIIYFISIFGLVAILSITIFVLGNKNPAQPGFHLPPPGIESREHNFRPPPGHGPNEFIPPYANLLIMSILLIGFDSGLLFFSKWMQSEQNKLKIEKESIKNKMAFLQNQISPHFFMNTLNNIHALVDITPEEAKAGIIKLSQMMDYMLYESQTDKIPIHKETEFIKSYVDLMKLRFTDEVDVITDIPSILPAVKIPPLLTISFIENAFKYGISYEAASFVHIHYHISESELTCKITNSLHPEKKARKNSGIGIKNARKRLDLIYADNYVLSITNDETKFEVMLNLPL